MTNPIPMFKEEPAEIWERDAARHSLDELFVLARQYKSGKEYRNLLNFISRFESLVNWKPSRCASWYGQRLGIENPSGKYLSTYVKDDDPLNRISLDCVIKAAGLIEQMGKERLATRKADDPVTG